MPAFNQSDEYFKPLSFNLKELFVKNDPFEIPEYQRSFAWDNQEYETLWNDITETEQHNFNNFVLVAEGNQKPHFLGAIVTEMPSSLQGVEYVIDGQQRLITLTILLALLSDAIQEVSDPALRQSLLSNVYQLTRIQDPSGLSSFQSRVKLNFEHQFFFIHVIAPANATVRQSGLANATNLNRIERRIKHCIEFFDTKLKHHFGQATDSTYNQRVRQFTETTLLLLTMLHVSVRRVGLAYTIFETLNTRGRDLTQADLIKNEIVSKAQIGNERTQVTANWVDMIKLLPDEDRASTEYVRHQYASSVADVKATALFATISEHLQSCAVLNYTTALKNEAGNYTRIVEANTGDIQTDELLMEISKTLEISMSYILLLAGAKVFGLNHQDFARLVKLTRDFCFRFMTVGTNGTVAKTEQIMGEAARTLRNTGQLQSVLAILQQNSPDALFLADFEVYQARKASTAFYILRQLEMQLAAGSGQMVPFTQSPQQHLEHIMPKTPKIQDWGYLMNDDRYTSFLNRVGNLLVLEANINTTIKNKSFDDKSSTSSLVHPNYTNSSLKLPHLTPTYLVGGRWTFDSIEQRQKELATTALNVWSLS